MPTKKELKRIDETLQKLDNKKINIFQAFEEDIITKGEFQKRREEINQKIRILQEEKQPLLIELGDDVTKEIPYEFIKSILKNFSKVLKESATREQQKQLLHMIISEITINELREIDSIKLNINDNLVEYLNEEGLPLNGVPSSFVLKNVGCNILNFNIAI